MSIELWIGRLDGCDEAVLNVLFADRWLSCIVYVYMCTAGMYLCVVINYSL